MLCLRAAVSLSDSFSPTSTPELPRYGVSPTEDAELAVQRSDQGEISELSFADIRANFTRITTTPSKHIRTPTGLTTT
jgi:hypothetical protein